MYGQNILSAFPNGDYGELTGTSMSTAFVTAGAAMVEAINDDTNIKELLIKSCDSLKHLRDKSHDGRKLNYNNIVNKIYDNEIVNANINEDKEIKYCTNSEETLKLFYAVPNVEIFATELNTYYIKKDGSLWATGDNSFGQLGNGTFESTTTPIKVYGLSNVKDIVSCGGFCMALDEEDVIYTWGEETQTIPKRIYGPYRIKSLAINNSDRFAVNSDGKVWAYGINADGSIGDGTEDRVDSFKLLDLEDIKKIACTGKSTFFLKNDGTVWSCGSNAHGILGRGKNLPQDIDIPVKIDGIENVKSITGGINHVCALRTDGTMYVWGSNARGQLGTNEIDGDSDPIVLKIDNISDVKAAGDYTIALKNDGTVWSWGYNYYGQLGIGNKTTQKQPVQISNLSNVWEISAGHSTAAAMDYSGNYWIWGRNLEGQFGNGTCKNLYTPTIINEFLEKGEETTEETTETTTELEIEGIKNKYFENAIPIEKRIIEGKIENEDDVVVYKIKSLPIDDTDKTTKYFFNLIDLKKNYDIFLYDENKNRIRFSRNSGTEEEFFTEQLRCWHDYYIAIKGDGTSGDSSYKLAAGCCTRKNIFLSKRFDSVIIDNNATKILNINIVPNKRYSNKTSSGEDYSFIIPSNAEVTSIVLIPGGASANYKSPKATVKTSSGNSYIWNSLTNNFDSYGGKKELLAQTWSIIMTNTNDIKYIYYPYFNFLYDYTIKSKEDMKYLFNEPEAGKCYF